MPHRPWPFLLVAIPVLRFACSNSPTTSNNTEPIADARTSFKSSDFSAALRNLDKAIKTAPDDATRQQAIELRTALVTALPDANKQMAEAYYIGAKQPAAQAHTGPFYEKRSDYCKTAQGYLIVEVTFPGFTGTNPGLNKIKTGQLVSDSEGLNAELQADRNAFAVVLSGVAGADQDPNKGQQVFSSGTVQVDPRVYLIELSNIFLQSGAMFEYRGLNSPDRLRTVNEVVIGNLDVAQKLLDAKPDNDLEARVKKMRTDCDKALKTKT
jgi:hypothetical protein